MNKAQKEVLSTQLNSEKATLLKLKRIYQQASKDCEHKIALLSARKDMENLQSVIYQKQYQQALKTQIDGVLAVLEGDQFDTVADYLKESYESGYTGVMYDLAKQGIPIVMPIDQKQVVKALEVDSKLSQGLYTRLHEDIGYLKKSIRAELSRGIANGSSWNDIATHIAKGMNSPFHRSLSNATRIARTEGHRIQQQSANDAQKKAVEKGADVVKQWCSMLDNRTRHNHAVLDGQIKELDELFTVNGKSAPYPGGFGDPAEDCNCRCCVTQRARWALDDEELKELKERAKYFGLDKTEDFDEFKNKYCKLPAKADKIKPNKLVEVQDLDKELQDTLRAYTDGEYGQICEYSQYLKTPDGKVSLFHDNAVWKKESLPQISETVKEHTKQLMDVIEHQPINNMELCRIERDTLDVKVGDKVTFGIRSTSSDLELPEKAFSGEMEGMDFSEVSKDFTEYHFVTSKSLNIESISEYSDQKEHLICGTYKVVDVKDIEPVSDHWETTEIPYTELFPDAEYFTSKKGKEMVRYSENGSVKTMDKVKYETQSKSESKWVTKVVGRRVVYVEVI